MEKPTDKHVQAIIEIIKGQDIFGSDPFGIYVDDEVYSPLVLIDGKVDLRPIAGYVEDEKKAAMKRMRDEIKKGLSHIDNPGFQVNRSKVHDMVGQAYARLCEEETNKDKQ